MTILICILARSMFVLNGDSDPRTSLSFLIFSVLWGSLQDIKGNIALFFLRVSSSLLQGSLVVCPLISNFMFTHFY